MTRRLVWGLLSVVGTRNVPPGDRCEEAPGGTLYASASEETPREPC